MSRSYRHHPIAGAWFNHDESEWKRNRSRRLRFAVKKDLRGGREPTIIKELNSSDGYRPKDWDGDGNGRGKMYYGSGPDNDRDPRYSMEQIKRK